MIPIQRLVPLCVAAVAVASGAAAESVAEPSAAGYAQVQRAFLREDFARVATLAERYLQQFPAASETPRVRLWLALSLDRLGETEEALRQLDAGKRHLKTADPLWPELLYWDGDISRRSEQTVRAKHAFSRVVTQFPDSPWTLQARLGLGLVYFSQQVIPEALVWFREVANTAPAGAPVALQARLMEAICDVRLNEFASAAAKMQRLLEQLDAPDDIVQASFYLGEAWSGLARYENALGAYARAMSVRPASRWATLSRFGRGWALFRMGRCREATEMLAAYIEATDDEEPRPEALFALGSCQLRLGLEREAEAPLHRLIRQTPRHALAIESGVLLADTWRRQRRLREAASLLTNLLSASQATRTRAQLQIQLGSIRLDQGRVRQARALFDAARAAPHREDQQAAVSGLGDVAMFLGRDDEAQRYYEAVRKLSTEGRAARYARYQLGRIRLLRHDAVGALAIFEELLAEAEAPLLQDVQLAMALAWLDQGDEQKARVQLEALRRDLSERSISPRAGYYVALLALTAGDEARTRKLCRETIDGARGSDEALEAQLLLIELDGTRSDDIQKLHVLFRDPNQPSRHRGKLAKVFGDQARHRRAYATAIRWYDEAVALWPALAGEASYAVASCYEEGGDIELAIHRYRLVVQRAWMVRGQLAAAKLLERQGRWKEAASVYESLAGQPIPEAKVAQERWTQLRHGL